MINPSPVLAGCAKHQGFQFGQQFRKSDFLATLASILTTIILNRDLQLKTEVNNIRLAQAQMDITAKLIAAAEFRDTDTGEHIKRMSQSGWH